MTAAPGPKVCIVVLNWNGWEDTIECVQSLKAIHYANYEIVVVDNASTDHSVQKITEAFPDLTILQAGANKGYAAGNNIGMRHGLRQGADYIWILNNDTAVAEDVLQPLVERMEKDKSIGICGSRLIYYHRRNTIQALGGGRYYKWLGVSRTIGEGLRVPAGRQKTADEVEPELDFIVGASMMVSRNFVETVGLMNELYFLYYEEMDWALRGKPHFRLGYAPESVIYHKHEASVNAGAEAGQKRSRLADYYQIKNRLKFTRTYFPICLPSVYLTVVYAVLSRLLKGQWGRAGMILKLMVRFNK
jgi:GT2 family glycosyltransferase